MLRFLIYTVLIFTAALFRASYKMQEALRQVLREEPHEMDGGRKLQYVLEALALSENTAETVTPA